MLCTCTMEYLPANAAPDAPYFPGIRRFPTSRVAVFCRDCVEHGYTFTSNIAAILHYVD